MSNKGFILTDSRYASGIQLDEYNGKYSLVDAYMGQDKAGDEKVWQKWGFRQTKEKKAADKSMPWRIDLGTREEAIDILRQLLVMLGDELPGPERLPDSQPTGSPEFDDIPY